MSSRGVIGGAKRAARIRKVIEDVMSRRAAGEVLSDAAVIVENGELMPELARELSLLSLLERARDSATGRSRSGRRIDGPIQPMGEDAFEGFRVLKEAHRGGQGVVYEAVQASTGRRVAIKMMREGLFAGDRDAQRFEREVRILGQLEHPGIVGIIASGIRGGHFYYVMDFVEGIPLDEYAATRGRRPREVLELIEKVAEALNAAHLRGIIHRDLKPGNILVDSAGRPRILDFGLARIAAENDLRVTAMGQFVGSMPWSSPEQATGDQAKVDIRTDVYSLGVILYQALMGRFPYPVDGAPRDVLNNILTASPGRMRSTDAVIDAGVDAIVRKCLSKERERRYQSAGELASDIQRYLSGRPVAAHPPDAWYQARMFTRRNKALVIGAACVVGALFLGLAGTTTGFLKASASRHAAVQERDAARKAEAVAESRRAEAEANSYAASIAAADAAIRVDDGANAKTHLRAAPEELRGWEWRFLAARADRSLETLAMAPVRDARTTPDGNHLLALGRDGSFSLTDLRDRRLVWSATAPGKVRDAREQAIIGFSANGSLAATQHDGVVVVWDLSRGALVTRLAQADTSWGIMSASFSPDGFRLATCGRNGHLIVWNLTDSRAMRDIDLKVVFSAGADYSPDGVLLAVGVAGGVQIFDGETLEPLRMLRPPANPHQNLGFVRFTPDGKRVIANFGSFIAAMDPTGELAPIVFRGGIQHFLRFDASRDGGHLVAGSWDRTVREWNLRTGELERTLVGHEAQVNTASFALDDSRIVSTSDDGVVKIWLPGSLHEPGVMPLNAGMLVNVLAPGDTAIFYGVNRVRHVDIAAEQELAMAGPPVALAVSTSHDGQLMAYTEGGADLSLWNIRSGTRLWTSQGLSGPIVESCFAPDGSVIVTTSVDGSLGVWDAATGSSKKSFKSVCVATAPVRFHPRIAQLVVGGSWGELGVWDTSNWTSRTIKYPAELGRPGVMALGYSPDGALLAAGDADGNVTVWDTASWNVVRHFSGMKPGVWCLAFSPDGQRLAVGGHDRMVHIFQTRDWRETLLLRGHSGVVRSVEWTPDGRRVISSAIDGTVRIWDAAPPTWDILPRAMASPGQ